MTQSLFIVGSPRAEGRSTALARALMCYKDKESPDTQVKAFHLAKSAVKPCTACDACAEGSPCIIEDDMSGLQVLLDEADELTIVAPVYFAGPPAQFKAVLDRMQPYYWQQRRKGSAAGGARNKRPLRLFVIGEGNDPHGFCPLVGTVRSALSVAGFRLEELYDCVGLSDEAIGRVVHTGLAGNKVAASVEGKVAASAANKVAASREGTEVASIEGMASHKRGCHG